MKTAVTCLVFFVAALLALGMVMLYSCKMNENGGGLLLRQLIWGGVGVVACVSVASTDYRGFKKIAGGLYAVAILLLLAVLIPHVGHASHGARRWVGFHGFLFQSSEFAKLALIVAMAWYGDRFKRHMPTWKRGIALPALFGGLLLGLIYVEPDRGTTMLLAVVSGVMLIVAGVPWTKFALPGFLAVGGLAVSIFHDPMRMKRIFSWLYLEEHKDGVGYQAYQAMLALGSGGWFGLGLGNSRQKMGFVPEHQTDFILSIIGEELGFVATVLVIVSFIAIVCCGIHISMKAPDTFGQLLGSGITFLIGMQAFINIGVVTSALPNKGLPLPFISYGGSNLLVMLTCVGVLISIASGSRFTQSYPAETSMGRLQTV